MKPYKILSILILIPLLLICGCSNNKPITEESILQKADEVLDKGEAESAIEYNNFILWKSWWNHRYIRGWIGNF